MEGFETHSSDFSTMTLKLSRAALMALQCLTSCRDTKNTHTQTHTHTSTHTHTHHGRLRDPQLRFLDHDPQTVEGCLDGLVVLDVLPRHQELDLPERPLRLLPLREVPEEKPERPGRKRGVRVPLRNSTWLYMCVCADFNQNGHNCGGMTASSEKLPETGVATKKGGGQNDL